MIARRRHWPALVVVIGVVSVAFLFGWRDHARGLARQHDTGNHGAVGTSGTTSAKTPRDAPLAADIEALRDRDLVVPIDGADVERWKGSFAETHNGHRHEAVDILVPRNTPIRAVEDGRIAKLFRSKAGGITIYQADPSGQFIYYYAHLERYADVHDGDAVHRGEVIGYVGTSGNAPPNTPHLHFAIFKQNNPRRWWEGTAIDPYAVFGAGQ